MGGSVRSNTDHCKVSVFATNTAGVMVKMMHPTNPTDLKRLRVIVVVHLRATATPELLTSTANQQAAPQIRAGVASSVILHPLLSGERVRLSPLARVRGVAHRAALSASGFPDTASST